MKPLFILVMINICRIANGVTSERWHTFYSKDAHYDYVTPLSLRGVTTLFLEVKLCKDLKIELLPDPYDHNTLYWFSVGTSTNSDKGILGKRVDGSVIHEAYFDGYSLDCSLRQYWVSFGGMIKYGLGHHIDIGTIGSYNDYNPLQITALAFESYYQAGLFRVQLGGINPCLLDNTFTTTNVACGGGTCTDTSTGTCFALPTYYPVNGNPSELYLYNDYGTDDIGAFVDPGIQITNADHLVFDIRSCSSVALYLANIVGSYSSAYGVRFESNRITLNMNYPPIKKSSAAYTAAISCFVIQTYWISWTSTTIKVGTGTDVGWNTLLEYIDSIPSFNGVVVRNSGVPAHFNFLDEGNNCMTITGSQRETIACVAAVNECASNPCQNGGTCTDHLGYYTCDCGVSITGMICETLIPPCSSNPCVNGGTCVDQTSAYSCACLSAFTGTTCEQDALFFPHGSAAGDTIQTGLSQQLYPVTLPSAMSLGSTSCTNVAVTTRGSLTCDINNVNLVATTPYVAALYEVNNDVSNAGSGLEYRVTTDSTIMAEITGIIQPIFFDFTSAQSALIVTWMNVLQLGTAPPAPINSYQLVFTTDGSYSFIILQYGVLEWAANAPVARINAGHDNVQENLPGSENQVDILNLVTRSNVGRPGRFVYRTDGEICHQITFDQDSSTVYFKGITGGSPLWDKNMASFVELTSSELVQDVVIRADIALAQPYVLVSWTSENWNCETIVGFYVSVEIMPPVNIYNVRSTMCKFHSKISAGNGLFACRWKCDCSSYNCRYVYTRLMRHNSLGIKLNELTINTWKNTADQNCC